jgi:hypothetical protein
MRNIFDQYKHPENRLSHALAVCLNEDRPLLGEFVSWVGGAAPASNVDLLVVEQRLPGDLPESEEETERRGLPDIVIHDDESWCILIESKIQAKLTGDQLDRHSRTLRRRGFEWITCVALTKADKAMPPKVQGRTWCGLYEWLGRAGRSREWPERLRSYLRVAEVRLAHEEYLTEGTLTMFDGFPFSKDNSYTYGEGKRLIKLAMGEIRKSPDLRKLGMDPKAPGRKKITGTRGRGVWDYLSLTERPRRGGFTSYPHLTLGVNDEGLNVAVTIPNGVAPCVRKKLAALSDDEYAKMNALILRRAQPIIGRDGRVDAYAVQRHHLSRSAPAIEDARVYFRLETSQERGSGRIKPQPKWARLFSELIKEKRANIQFGYQVKLPWGTPGLESRKAVGIIADTWCAMKPLLDVVRG